MVKHFLANQSRRIFCSTWRDLDISVASTFNQSQTTARNLILWENSWVADKMIPEQDN